MEIFLIIVVVLQFIYLVYYTRITSVEREKLQLMALSKDIREYVETQEPVVENTEVPKDPRIPIEEATIDEILKAEIR